MNTRFQVIFLTKYYNKRQNAVNILFDAYSKSAFQLLKSSTWLTSFLVTWDSGSTKPSNYDRTKMHSLLSNFPASPSPSHISLHIASINHSLNQTSLSYLATNIG